MENTENLKVLKELHTGAEMGIKAISFVSENVENDEFRKELSTQYNQYEDILNKVTDLYNEYGEVPQLNHIKNDMMTWMGVQMNTINDKSNSKISEMLIQGTVMGIIEGRKILNHNPNVDQNIKNTLNEFVQLQENNISRLKEFL